MAVFEDYIEPFWSCKPFTSFSLEVMKEGQILDTLELSTKPFYVVGRDPT